MSGTALLLSLDCSTLPLIRTLKCRVLSKEVSSTIFFKSLVWLDLGLKPDLPDHWRTLYLVSLFKDIWPEPNLYQMRTGVKPKSLKINRIGPSVKKTLKKQWYKKCPKQSFHLTPKWDPNRYRSNGNARVLFTLKICWTRALPSDSVYCHA